MKRRRRLARSFRPGDHSLSVGRSQVALRTRPRWSDCVNASRARCSGNVGFTLLEVILSLAILAGSLATLGEIMRLAEQNAGFAREETTAELLASSVMEQLLSGSRDVAATTKQPFEYQMTDPWVYSITTEPTSVQEVMRVGVRVELNIESRLEPPHFELYRWILSPQYVSQITQTEQRIAQDAEMQAQLSEQRMANAASTTGAGGTGSASGGSTTGGSTTGGSATGGSATGGATTGGGATGGSR
jgi:type II secretion system protein I